MFFDKQSIDITSLFFFPLIFFFCSMKFSRELSYTRTSFGASFRSEKESVNRIGIDGIETGKSRQVSIRRMYSMVGPDWMYGVVGIIGALIAGAQMPLFALGVSQALVSYYMDWDTTQKEIKKIAFLFLGGAILTVIVHAFEHLCFGIMGERLTLRVREKMFSGKHTIFNHLHLYIYPFLGINSSYVYYLCIPLACISFCLYYMLNLVMMQAMDCFTDLERFFLVFLIIF